MEFMNLVDRLDFVSGFVPVDMQTADNNGTWVNMDYYHGAIIVLFKGIGTAGQDPIFLVQQSKVQAGTNPKALNYARIRAKVGATAVNAVASATEYLAQTASTFAARTDGASPVTVGNSYTDAASAENEAIMWVAIKATDLDVQGGYKYFNIKIADVGGNAQLGCALYIMVGARYAQYPNQSSIG